jgi:uncharacterized protein YndB with AHSA1/START domain
MTQAIQVEPIHKSIVVNAPLEKAFRVFTGRIGEWWPLETHAVDPERAETAVIEGWEGGRLLERSADGTEHVWGTVLAWEPPRRIVYSWHPGRSEETSQEVEMRFTGEGRQTLVELEHRGWERLGEKAGETRPRYDEGWDFVLARYVEAADR